MSTRQLWVMGGLVFSTSVMAEQNDYIGTTAGIQVQPSVNISSEYRSNLYLEEGPAGGGGPVTSGTALLINPVFTLRNQGPTVQTQFSGGYGARKYFQKELQNLNTFNDGRFDARVVVLPRSPINFAITDGFSSNNRPVNQPESKSALIRVYDNKSKATAMFGNNALKMGLGGLYNFYQVRGLKDANGVQILINQRNTYGMSWNGQWKFLPKTSVFVDGSYYQNKWLNNTIETGTGTTNIYDSSAWDTSFGLEGQWSSKTIVRLGSGFGGATYGEQTSADATISGIKERLRIDSGIRIKPTSAQEFRIEYKRSFQDVYFTNYDLYNQIDLGYDVRLQDRANVKTAFMYRNDNYDGPVDRTDHRLRAMAGVDYTLMQHLTLETSANWRRLASADGIASIEYDDVGVLFGLHWGY